MKLQSTVRHEFSKNLQKRPFMFKQLLFTGYYAKKKMEYESTTISCKTQNYKQRPHNLYTEKSTGCH